MELSLYKCFCSKYRSNHISFFSSVKNNDGKKKPTFLCWGKVPPSKANTPTHDETFSLS